MYKRILIFGLVFLAALSGAQSLRNPAYLASLKPAAASGGGAPAVSLSVSNSVINAITFVTNIITVPAGDANRLLLVTIGVGDDAWERPRIDISGVGLDSTSITNNILWETNDAGWVATATYYYKAPPTGLLTNIYFPSSSKSQLSIGIVLITNANQTATFGTPAAHQGTGTAPSVTVASTVGTALVYCSVATDAQNTLTVNNGTQIWFNKNIDSDTDFGGSRVAGGASVTPSWTTTSAGFAIGAVSINAP